MAKRVLVACGTGSATSTVVASKVKDLLDAHGVEAQVSQCKLVELEERVSGWRPDVVVVTGTYGASEVAGVPVVKGFAFLTGVGIDAVVAQLLQRLGS